MQVFSPAGPVTKMATWRPERRVTKNKDLAAYGILCDTPRAPEYSHLHLTCVL